MPRAYSPRLSTIHLMGDILRLPGVWDIRSIPPNNRRGTLIRVYYPLGNYIDMTIPQARAWLAAQKGEAR